MPAVAEIRFTSPAEERYQTTEGIVTLAWEASGNSAPEFFELQQSSDPSFPEGKTRIRYRGVDSGSVVSGLGEGIHHFRVHTVEPGDGEGKSEWSAPVAVEVTYMEKPKVLLLLASGAAVFFATLAALIIGHFRSFRGLEGG